MAREEPRTFPRFPDLPMEIRVDIWKLCLPHRIVELDSHFWYAEYENEGLNSSEGQQCEGSAGRFRNSRMPLIATVCREARRIVIANGQRINKSLQRGFLRNFWWQPMLDVVHINWSPWFDVDWGWKSDISHDTIPKIFDLANSGSAMVSLDHKLIHYFEYQPEDDFKNQLAGDGSCLQPSLLQIAWFANGPCLVTVKMITLHLDNDDAAQSGLFGMFADECLQLVDIDDIKRIRAYYNIWATKAFDRHLGEPVGFKHVLNNDQFHLKAQLWSKKTKFLFLTQAWAEERHDKFRQVECPEDIWQPAMPEERYVMPQWGQHVANDWHPWVQQARARLPQLTPKIMFRHCSNRRCAVSFETKHFVPKNRGGRGGRHRGSSS